MIRFHATSHEGKVRAHNEDAMFADGDNGIFVVADGVGGRAAALGGARVRWCCARSGPLNAALRAVRRAGGGPRRLLYQPAGEAGLGATLLRQ